MMATVDHKAWERVGVEGADDVPAGTTVTLKDVLGRIRDLNTLYAEVTGEVPSILSAGLEHITNPESLQVPRDW